MIVRSACLSCLGWVDRIRRRDSIGWLGGTEYAIEKQLVYVGLLSAFLCC